MNDTWDITQDCQKDVDEEVAAAATLKEDTKRREDDGENNLANVTRRRILARASRRITLCTKPASLSSRMIALRNCPSRQSAKQQARHRAGAEAMEMGLTRR